ncbi:MAG: hypothetical protein ACI8RD_005605, partial [Bacillariaceae sp.]
NISPKRKEGDTQFVTGTFQKFAVIRGYRETAL